VTLFGLSPERLGLFAVAVLLLVLTPGPVWVYLIGRTLAQGRRAGFVSLLGVLAGVALHALLAATGLSVLVLAVPYAFDTIRLAGAAYLLWLAWSTLRGAGLDFSARALPAVPDRVLLRQAFAAATLNPKVAVFYLSLFPQFVEPGAGSVFAQSLVLGAVHLAVSALCDALLVAAAGAVAAWLAGRPAWLRLQRWALGASFGALALWLALAPTRPAG
jgi:threonine/homoserine/homoserine lactone efflux protein